MVRIAVLIAFAPLAAVALEVPGFVAAALEQTVSLKGARANVTEYRATLPEGCTASKATALNPLDSGGRAILRLAGKSAGGTPCEGFASIRARMSASVLVTGSFVRRDQPLVGTTIIEERDITGMADLLDVLPEGALSTRQLSPGTMLTDRMVRAPGPSAGTPVSVVVRSGAITLTQGGRIVPCGSSRSCASLPSGKRVEGVWVDGQLLVEAR
jgi:hypothetical protein